MRATPLAAPQEVSAAVVLYASLVGIVIATALRAPFFTAPISGDEGGYAVIARWWAEGTPLYSDGALVDRPQLLMVLYRIADALAPGNPLGVRLLAAVFGMASVALSAVLAARLTHDRRAVWAAAIIAGFVGASPALESFSAYGELLAGVPTLGAMALFVQWWRSDRPQVHSLVAAGALGACAVLIKQSGFDGLMTIATVLIAGALGVAGKERVRRCRIGFVALVGGAVVPAGLALAHGVVTVGLVRYWNALAGYRLKYLSVVDGSTVGRLGTLAGQSARIWPLLVSICALSLIGSRGGSRRVVSFAWIWFGWSFLGFLAGGLFWLHYFLGPILPLTLLSAMGVSRLLRPPRRVGSKGPSVLIAVLVIGLCTVLTGAINIGAIAVGLKRNGQETLLEIDHRHQMAADYVRVRTKPGDLVQGLWQSGPVSWHSGRRPISRYLWATWFLSVPGALDQLALQLSGPDRPAYVVEIHDLDLIKGSGVVAAALDRNYVLETTLEDVEIWRRSDRPEPVVTPKGPVAAGG